MKIIEEFLKIENIKLEIKLIEITKKLSNTPLILLHEGLGSVALWKEWPKLLAEKLNRTVLVYSRHGMGKSSRINLPRKKNFMHIEASKYLKKIVENYCTTEPVLFGHSDGASISIIYAGLNLPLKALIVEAPHIFVEDITVKEISKLKSEWHTSDIKERLQKYHENVELAFLTWCNIWLSKDFKSWNIENYVKKIEVPTLAIQGINDQYGTLRQIELLEKNIIKNFSKLIIDNCKHNPHSEYPNLILKKTDNFLLNY